jgi:chromatin segregation and condensation protein Rec8/ScpA/Scc1 (kleisin family)
MSDEIVSPMAESVETADLDPKKLTHVKLPVFEGPLDLLLYLIKKDELDIYDIPIERITTQYLDYLRLIKMLDLEIAGEYLVVAATLVYIKSRTILPHDQRPPEDEADEEDPRWELVRQLVEYKKYKDAAFELQQCLTRQENVHGRGGSFKTCSPFFRRCSRAPATTRTSRTSSRTGSPSATRSSSSRTRSRRATASSSRSYLSRVPPALRSS